MYSGNFSTLHLPYTLINTKDVVMKIHFTQLSTLFQKHKQLIVFLVLMSIFRSAIADWYTVPSGSMQPTIEVGDRIFVNKMAYDLRFPFTAVSLVSLDNPKHGEIVVFESKTANLRLIKRIIGLPGDVVAMKNDVITVNGHQLEYFSLDGSQDKTDTSNVNYYSEKVSIIKHRINIDTTTNNQLSNFAAVIVPKGHYLVLGDNRRHSADSRVYGFVPHSELRGKATAIAFSLDYDNYYIPRKERFFQNIYARNL
jgi:signal peptidase I